VSGNLNKRGQPQLKGYLKHRTITSIYPETDG